MLKRTAVRKDWTISMSESDFRKLVEKCQWEIDKLEEENKKLKEKIDELEKCNLNLQERLDRKEELNKSYRKEIKEHKLYEEKLEHRIIEFEELLHWE